MAKKLDIFELEGEVKEKAGIRLDNESIEIINGRREVDVGNQFQSMFIRSAIKYLNENPEVWEQVKENFQRGDA